MVIGKKPPVGTKLNKNHPLAKGLINAWVFNEMAGNPKNLIPQGSNGPGSGLTLINGDPDDGLHTMDWMIDSDGPHLHSPAANDRCETFETVDPDTIWRTGSIVMGMKPTTLVASTQYRFFGSHDNFEARMTVDSGWPIESELLDDTTHSGVARVAVDKFCISGHDWTNNGISTWQRVFFDGEFDYAENSAQGTTAPGRLAIGSSLNNYAQGLIGNVYFFYQWNRELSDAAHAQIAANPYQIFEPKRIYVPLISDISIETKEGPLTLTGVYTTGNTGTVGVNNLQSITGVVGTSATGNVVVQNVSIEQEGFRWRNDDGSEITATWRQLQDVDDQIAKELTIRLRTLMATTGNAPSQQATLQYKRDDEAASEWRDV